jgi:hypothetical protein
MSKPNIELHISYKIKDQDFIVIHKDKLESLVMNADILNWLAETSDKIGAAFLGVWLTLLGTANYTKAEIYGSFIFGAFLTFSGIYYKCQRNKKIRIIINEAVREAETREYFLNCVSFDRSGSSTSTKGLTNVSSKRQTLIQF